MCLRHNIVIKQSLRNMIDSYGLFVRDEQMGRRYQTELILILNQNVCTSSVRYLVLLIPVFLFLVLAGLKPLISGKNRYRSGI